LKIEDLNLLGNWSLFLDRDGVLNKHRVDDYVKNWSEWEWNEGVLEALSILSDTFSRIIVVTNQQGIGKGLMSSEDVEDIHKNMIREATAVGGRIDKVYFAPELKTNPENRRKPKPDMAYEAYQDFPEIDFRKSLIVGDSDSDIRFGQGLGMGTVRISSAYQPMNVAGDIMADSLLEFAHQLTMQA
jgi:histidinol-phosphate phosphatase family protein